MQFSIGALALAAVACAGIFTMNSCAVRQHDFKIACIERGGMVLDRQSGSDCIVAGRRVSDFKSE